MNELLKFVQKTNKEITLEKLKEELLKSSSATVSILFAIENCKAKEG